MAATVHHTQTHAEVTRDVVATLGTPGRGYYAACWRGRSPPS